MGGKGSTAKAAEAFAGRLDNTLPGSRSRASLPPANEGECPVSVFGEWLVLRETPARGGECLGLNVTDTEHVTRALRGAMLRHAEDPAPAVLSGHAADGSPLARPHVAFLALCDAASRQASGAVLGTAIVLPKDVSEDDRRAVVRALERWEQNAGMRLFLGRAGVMQLERHEDRVGGRILGVDHWITPSRRWGSVTPVALDEHPGNLAARDAAELEATTARAEWLVSRAVTRIGLPVPTRVRVMRCSAFRSSPSARRFAPFPRRGRGFKRILVHVELSFDAPVAGPVLVGAGRYFGLGLCRPIPDGN